MAPGPPPLKLVAVLTVTPVKDAQYNVPVPAAKTCPSIPIGNMAVWLMLLW